MLPQYFVYYTFILIIETHVAFFLADTEILTIREHTLFVHPKHLPETYQLQNTGCVNLHLYGASQFTKTLCILPLHVLWTKYHYPHVTNERI